MGGGGTRRAGAWQGLALAVDHEVGLDRRAAAGDAGHEQYVAGGRVPGGYPRADHVGEAVAGDGEGKAVPVNPAVGGVWSVVPGPETAWTVLAPTTAAVWATGASAVRTESECRGAYGPGQLAPRPRCDARARSRASRRRFLETPHGAAVLSPGVGWFCH